MNDLSDLPVLECNWRGLTIPKCDGCNGYNAGCDHYFDERGASEGEIVERYDAMKVGGQGV
jgi:hypothetical protein